MNNKIKKIRTIIILNLDDYRPNIAIYYIDILQIMR